MVSQTYNDLAAEVRQRIAALKDQSKAIQEKIKRLEIVVEQCDPMNRLDLDLSQFNWADAVEHVLVRFDSVKIPELVAILLHCGKGKGASWRSRHSSCFSALQRNPDRFEKLKDGRWALKTKTKSSE